MLRYLLESSFVYRYWQAPFAGKKIRPVLAANDLSQVKRVLDVGCGPGTNAATFAGQDYLGLDINPAYIRTAKKRYQGRFEVQDVRSYKPPGDDRYDFILMNSFLHHVNDEETKQILAGVAGLLSEGGTVHILDLVLPERRSVARFLAKADRGDHARPLERWRELFSEAFEPISFEPYAVTGARVPLWEMVYFKGGKRA